MGKMRDLFKKIRDTKGTKHAKMGTIKDRYGMPTKVTIVKAVVFLVLIYAFDCWTIKKAECQ